MLQNQKNFYFIFVFRHDISLDHEAKISITKIQLIRGVMVLEPQTEWPSTDWPQIWISSAITHCLRPVLEFKG